MDSEENTLTISINYKEESFDFSIKDIIPLKEIKEKWKKEKNLLEIDINTIKLYYKDTEINSYEDIINNAEFSDDENLKIDLKLEIEEIKLDKITSNINNNIILNNENINDINNVNGNENNINIKEENKENELKEDNKIKDIKEKEENIIILEGSENNISERNNETELKEENKIILEDCENNISEENNEIELKEENKINDIKKMKEKKIKK